MNRTLTALLLFFGSVASSSLAAQIYSYVDADGQPVFTDQPPVTTSSSKVELPTINRMPAGQRVIKLQAPAELKRQLEPPPPPYQQLTLISPQPDDTLRNTGAVVDIQVSSIPQLRPGHHYQAWLDGAAHGGDSTETGWQIHGVERGSHQLSVQLLDETGKILMQTPAVTIHIKQTTLAERRRIRPCEEEDYGLRPECPLADKPKKEPRRWWRLGL